MTICGGLYNVREYREAAKRRMPRAFFKFFDRGTEDEHASRANRNALESVKQRQRILQDGRQIDTSTEVFGRKLPVSLATAPTGVADIRDLEMTGIKRACGLVPGGGCRA